MPKKEKRLEQMQAGLQVAIHTWLRREGVNLHGADIDTVALQMMMGAKAAFTIAMVEHEHRSQVQFDE